MVRAFFWTTFFSICLIIFETAILSNIMILPIIPDLVLIFLIFVSIHNRVVFSEALGFTSGLVLDFLTISPLGLNALMRTIIGYISATVKEYVIVSSIFVPMFFVFVATLLKAFMLFILSFLYPGSIFGYSFLSAAFLTELLTNTLLAPILFAFFTLFSPLLCEQRFNGRDS